MMATDWPEAVELWDNGKMFGIGNHAAAVQQMERADAAIAALKEMVEAHRGAAEVLAGLEKSSYARAEKAEAEVEKLREKYRPDAVDKCVDELRAEVERLRKSHRHELKRANKAEAEVERLKAQAFTCPSCGEQMLRSDQIREVERLKWMLDEACRDMADEITAESVMEGDPAEVLADLAARWEENHE